MKKLAQGFNTTAQDSNPGSLSRESGGLPLSHCVLCYDILFLLMLLLLISNQLCVDLICGII